MTTPQQLAQREMARGWQPLAVKLRDFLNAMASAKVCKQPGVDGVVVEMVRSLSWPTLLWLYLLFLMRSGGRQRPEACGGHSQKSEVGFRAMSLAEVLCACFAGSCAASTKIS